MISDIEIAQKAQLKPISDIAATLNLANSEIIPYGYYMAKLSPSCIDKLENK
jgi:formate--tetrahydrofolate ligase